MEETTHEPKKEGLTLTTPIAIIVAGAIIAGAVLYVKGPSAPSTNVGGGEKQQQALDASEIEKVLQVRDGDFVLGNSRAPVTLVEFGDFECPFCAQFHINARKEILSKYVDTGQVKIIWRHFPLSSIHATAQIASEAVECAGEQGKFWQYHDAIYENQESLAKDFLDDYARTAGISNVAAFTSCVDSGKYTQKVADDFNLGISLQVSGTPTFFINGNQIVGAVPFASIEPLILQALQE